MKRLSVLFGAIALTCTPAFSQISGIYVEYYDLVTGWTAVSGFPNINASPTPNPGLPSGSSISLPATSGTNYRIYAVNPNTTDIGNISVSSGSGSGTATLFIGRPAGTSYPIATPFLRLPAAGCRNLGRVQQSGVTLKVQGYIEGTLNNFITVREIVRFDFGTSTSSGTGTIAANISHNPSADPAVTQLGGIYAKRVAPGAVITSYNSDIRELRTYSDFEGTVQTTNGQDIQTLAIAGDFDGVALIDGNINSLIISGDGVGSITAGGNLVAGTISGHWGAHPVGASPNYDSSSIHIDGNITTSLVVTGDFVGTLEASDIALLTIGGGLYDYVSGAYANASVIADGDIQTMSVGVPLLGTATGTMLDFEADSVANVLAMGSDYVSGSAVLYNGLPEGATLRIGGTLASATSIEVENDPLDTNDVGLQGQILINQLNTSNTWDGTIQVFDGTTTTVLSPNYTELSGELGDPISMGLGSGAVGVAPFNFHQRTTTPPAGVDRDCNPYHTEAVDVGDCEAITDLDEVIIDHYGSVYVTGTGPHFRVEYKPDYLPSSWTDATSQFEVDTTRTATSDGGTNRKAYLVPASGNSTHFNSAGRFRIRPLAGKVKCANVTGNPDVVYDSNITSGDLGSTGGTQYDWFQFRVRLSLCSGLTVFEGEQVNAADIAAWPGAPFEVNADGQTDSQDFADMLDAYNN